MTAIVFDLDGTLVDSFDDISHAFCRSFGAIGAPAPEPSAVRPLIGRPLRDMYRWFVPDEEAIATLVAEYRRDYALRCADSTRPFPGVPSLLEELRAGGHAVAVATTKTSSMARTVVARLGLEALFDHVQGTDGFAHKPAPDVITHALAAVGRPGAWMVGDAVTDVLAGRAAGLRTCAVTWGVDDETNLRRAEPDAVATTVDQLRALLIPSSF